jgi:hypothetical protein
VREEEVQADGDAAREGGTVRRSLLAILIAAAALMAPAPSAEASFGLESFDVTYENAAGETEALAGAHPYQMKTKFSANFEEINGKPFPEEQIKDFELALMPGFIGDNGAVHKCSTVDFLEKATLINNATKCSNSSVLGIVHARLGEGEGALHAIQYAPLYNLEPPPGSVARLGFNVLGTPVTLTAGVGEEFPNQVEIHTRNISQVLEFLEAEVTVWGVPADPSHDPLRGTCLNAPEGTSEGICPAGENPRPFITLPRSCEGPLATEFEMDSWQNPGVWVGGFTETHDNAVPPNPQGMIGCGSLGFNPTTDAIPSTSQAESSAGVDFEINVADEGLKSPKGQANADIEALEIAFPKGVTANPSAAEGLGVCTLEEYEEESLENEACPAASKLGSIEAETPIEPEHPLRGSLYLAEQGAGNPFGSLLALYTVIKDPELGVSIKFATEVETDSQTGQLIATSEELPPYPLSHVKVRLRPGPRAPFITPPTCGTYVTEATLYPSSGAEPLISTSTFEIASGSGGAPCPSGNLPFHEGFEAGSINNAAGTYSPFSLRLTRQDGDQDITRFSAVLPPGVTGKIAGIGRCSEAQIAQARGRSAPGEGRLELASPSCPASSLVGHIIAGAGVGTALTYVPGSLYLAGPFGGDPLSAVAVVPAVAGPFDVGTVVTRVALTLNETTGQVEVDGAASEPIPHILHGIPLKLRDLRVLTDRPEFMLNATSCKVFNAVAEITGGGSDPFTTADDQVFSAPSRYQAASCASLLFSPNLKLELKGQTRRGGHPKLHSVLTYPKGPGYANTGKAIVVLPHSQFIDPARVANPCIRALFAENKCPPSSRLGFAKAWTPLLDEPLEGPVYFRSNGGVRKLPDIVADLRGQFHIVVVGAVDSVGDPNHARIRTTFSNVPDAPVSRFVLDLKGGKEGVIENSANLCAKKRNVSVELTGQNGRRHDFQTPLRVKCSKKSKGN